MGSLRDIVGDLDDTAATAPAVRDPFTQPVDAPRAARSKLGPLSPMRTDASSLNAIVADLPESGGRESSRGRSPKSAFDYPVTSRPGAARDGGKRRHGGTDYGAPVGSDVDYRDDDEGEVIEIGEDSPKAGRFMRVRGRNGGVSFYAHLSESNAKVGDKVTRGQVIARSGGARGAPGAGNSSGPHLHYSHTPWASAETSRSGTGQRGGSLRDIVNDLDEVEIPRDTGAGRSRVGLLQPMGAPEAGSFDPPAKPANWSDGDEEAFRAWYWRMGEKHKLNLDPNPDAPEHHYDYRQAFRAGAEPDATGHWPSQFKTADHPRRYGQINGQVVDTTTGEVAPAGTVPGFVEDQPNATAPAKPYTVRLGRPPKQPTMPKIPTPAELAAAPAVDGEERVSFTLGDKVYENVPVSAATKIREDLASYITAADEYENQARAYNAALAKQNDRIKRARDERRRFAQGVDSLATIGRTLYGAVTGDRPGSGEPVVEHGAWAQVPVAAHDAPTIQPRGPVAAHAPFEGPRMKPVPAHGQSASPFPDAFAPENETSSITGRRLDTDARIGTFYRNLPGEQARSQSFLDDLARDRDERNAFAADNLKMLEARATEIEKTDPELAGRIRYNARVSEGNRRVEETLLTRAEGPYLEYASQERRYGREPKPFDEFAREYANQNRGVGIVADLFRYQRAAQLGMTREEFERRGYEDVTAPLAFGEAALGSLVSGATAPLGIAGLHAGEFDPALDPLTQQRQDRRMVEKLYGTIDPIRSVERAAGSVLAFEGANVVPGLVARGAGIGARLTASPRVAQGIDLGVQGSLTTSALRFGETPWDSRKPASENIGRALSNAVAGAPEGALAFAANSIFDRLGSSVAARLGERAAAGEGGAAGRAFRNLGETGRERLVRWGGYLEDELRGAAGFVIPNAVASIAKGEEYGTEQLLADLGMSAAIHSTRARELATGGRYYVRSGDRVATIDRSGNVQVLSGQQAATARDVAGEVTAREWGRMVEGTGPEAEIRRANFLDRMALAEQAFLRARQDAQAQWRAEVHTPIFGEEAPARRPPALFGNPSDPTDPANALDEAIGTSELGESTAPLPFEPGQRIAITNPSTGEPSYAMVLEVAPDGVRVRTARTGREGVIPHATLERFGAQDAGPPPPIVPLPHEVAPDEKPPAVDPNAEPPTFVEGDRIETANGASGTVRRLSANGGIVVETDHGAVRSLSPDMVAKLGVRPVPVEQVEDSTPAPLPAPEPTTAPTRDWSLVPRVLRPGSDDPRAFDEGLAPADFSREAEHARNQAQQAEREFRKVAQQRGSGAPRARDLYDAAEWWRARESAARELAGEQPRGRGRRGQPAVQVLGGEQQATSMPAARAGATVTEGTPLPPDRIATTGRTVQISTSRGTKVEVAYAIVDLRDLATSHDLAGNENPRYPGAMQPRDRTRTASAAQIKGIASALDPERLGENYLASDGAPIVGPDGIVESGNGRALALQEAYANNPVGAARYRDWLRVNAERFGLDAAAVERLAADPGAMPALVRVRRSEVDRAAFAREANEQSTGAMSAAEQAQADARVLSPEMLAVFRPGERGEIGADANTEFIRRFLGATVAPSELGRYVTADGALNQDGVARVQRAIIARAYGTSDAVEALAESTDSNVKNILAGMTQAAPRVAQARASITDPALDIGPEISAAMQQLSNLRAQGMSVADYLRQGDMFGGGLSPIARDLLVEFDANARSPKAIRAALEGWADAVDAIADPRQASMFGPAPAPDKAEIIAAALARAREVSANEPEQREVLAPVDASESRGAGGIGAVAGSRETTQAIRPGAPEAEAAPRRAVAPSSAPTKPIRQAFAAGMSRGAVEFVDQTQRDLYNLGAELRRRMRGGRNKSSERPNKDLAALRNPLAGALGISEGELDNLALATHTDVREQMKGLGDGETRRVDDNVRETEEHKHKFGSTQINAPEPVAAKVREFGERIPDDALAGDGRETEPHVTVLYGLKSPEDIEGLRRILGETAPFDVTVGKTSTFPPSTYSDGAAVLKADITAPELEALHTRIDAADDVPTKEQDFDTYAPHMTIAYVKPERAAEFTGRADLEGQTIHVDRIVVSDRDGNQVELPLGGEQVRRSSVIHRDLGQVEDLGPGRTAGTRAVRREDGTVSLIRDPDTVGNRRVEKPAGAPARTPSEAEIAAVNPHDFWNFSKAELSTSARGAVERLVREAVAERGLNPKDVRPMADVRAAAGDIAPEDVVALGRENALHTKATIHPEVYFRAREVGQGYARRAADLREMVMSGRGEQGELLSATAKDEMATEADRLEADARTIFGELAGARTDLGRNFAYLRMTAGDALAPDVWVQRARRIAERSGEDLKSTEWEATERKIVDAATRAGAERDAEAAVVKRIDDLLRSTTDDTPKLAREIIGQRAAAAEKVIEKLQGRLC